MICRGGLSVCPECELRWEQSGIIPALLRVDWSALKSEDPRLKLMLDGYKLANKLRLSDGLGIFFVHKNGGCCLPPRPMLQAQ